MVIHSRFYGCDIRVCVAKSKSGENLLDISLLSQGDGFVLEIASDADSEKPVDITEINELEMLVELGFGLS